MRECPVLAITADGVTLWWESVGVGEAVVLLPGRGDSSDLFPSRFVDQLVAAGFTVIRMDPRDTGLSGDGGDEYTLSSLADDVVTVLDAAGRDGAHTVAVSMGGMITVDLVSRHPDRVLSSVFIAAMSPDPEAGFGPDFFAALDIEDPVDMFLALMGSPSDDDRAWVVAELERADSRCPRRPEAGTRHMAASFRFGWAELNQLSNFAAPALVIHGTADRVLPVRHATSLATGIHHSELELIDGMGHLPTRHEWDQVGRLAVAHLSRSPER